MQTAIDTTQSQYGGYTSMLVDHVNRIFALTGNAVINNTGFTLPVYYSSTVMNWVAIE